MWARGWWGDGNGQVLGRGRRGHLTVPYPPCPSILICPPPDRAQWPLPLTACPLCCPGSWCPGQSARQVPQARARAAPPWSPEPRAPEPEDQEGLTLFVISSFNPQMGQRLTLFRSGTEKALTIICF